MKYILVFLSFALLAGCAGQLYTIPDPKPDANGRIYGVIVYQPKPVVFIYETTQHRNANGKVDGERDQGTCVPEKSYEVFGVPDYTKQYAIGYDAALFETYKFSLELDQGVITKVNNESTSGAKDVLEAFKGIVGTAINAAKEMKAEKEMQAEKDKKGKRKTIPKCNAEKEIVGRRDMLDIPVLKP